MKWIASLAGVLIIGYILGGWAPRTEQHGYEAEIARLNQALKERPRTGDTSLRGITQMLNVPEVAEEMESEPAEPEAEAQPTDADPEEAAEEEKKDPPDSKSFSDHIEEAAEVWGLQSDLARDALLSSLRVSGEQALQFDIIMEAMNQRLEETIANWAEILAADKMPATEAGIRMMNEISQILVIAHDELDESLPAGWDEDLNEEAELIRFIDPLVALPLADVEEKLESFE